VQHQRDPRNLLRVLARGIRHKRGRSAGRVLLAAVRGGRRSWKEALGCAAGLLVSRSVACTGGEGRARIEGPEDVLARANCGGVGDGQHRRLPPIRAAGSRCGSSRCAGELRRCRVVPRATADKKRGMWPPRRADQSSNGTPPFTESLRPIPIRARRASR
jgi:hypothetical protein